MLSFGAEAAPGLAFSGRRAGGGARVRLGGLGGPAVEAQCLQAGVTGELGDQDQVFAAADELVDESVPADMRGGWFIESGVLGDGGEHAGGAAGRQPATATIQEEGLRIAAAGPGTTLIQPVLQRLAQWDGDRHRANLAALPVDHELASPRRETDVVDVECDGVADPQPGIQGKEGQRPVPDTRPGLDGADPPDLGVVTEGAGRGLGQVIAGDAGLAQTTPDVEVVQGGEGVVGVPDGSLRVGAAEQVAPVVADRPVAGGGLGERVTVGPAGAVVAGQPGQVLANPG